MQEWLDQMEAQCSLLEPRYLPMLVPPVAWTSPLQGGYLTHQNRTDFIKDCKPELRDDLLSMDISQVYSAVNTIQATPWAVNEAVLDVMQELAGTGARIGGLPAADDMPVPQRPDDIPSDLRVADMDERTKARFDAWRFEAHAAYNRNVEERSKRLQLATQLTMAETLRGVEEFYFPHNVDFRGRVYSLVPEFNPQQSDLGKSLLQFAKGKPLGDSGAYWLAVHISNLFGNDKVPFDERVEWTAKHSAEIMDSAMSPLDGQRFWATADEPFQFLAACFEWTGYQVEGDEYVSVLPVAMDGSCSGLQHFSAMLKDEQGAQATNLCRQDRPSDIYTQVAEWVETYLEGEDEQLAAAWQGKVLRKIVKRPCMTFAYSVTSRGIRDQILDELRKQGEEFIPSHDNWELANYLAPVVEDGIRATVKRAAEAMDWLKVSVKTLLDNDTPVAWYTPLGFPVQQKYWQSTAKRYNVWFQGRRLRFNLRVDNTKPDARKMGSAVAPNFVHSMDATHLMMVVNRMQDEGITDNVAVIHDSFGVHACDTDELHAVIRDEFINLYSTDQLKVAHNYWEQAANAALAAPPELGEYDLEEVRDADFFFA
jgi:DNA-directed RNA polymerase